MTPSFGLIIIGDEILSGKRADKHLPKVIELLAARGLPLAYAEYVGDDPERITATLERAFTAARTSGEVVFSTGGIGATPDDHTRQCAAKALGVGPGLFSVVPAGLSPGIQRFWPFRGGPRKPGFIPPKTARSLPVTHPPSQVLQPVQVLTMRRPASARSTARIRHGKQKGRPVGPDGLKVFGG